MVTMTKKIDRTSKEYWEQILKKEGLGLDAGRDPGHRKLILVGSSADLDAIHEMQVGENGKVRPAGPGPDEERSMQ